MNMKRLLLFTIVLFSFKSFSQDVLLYSTDFESSNTFLFTQSTLNSFIIGQCAGNGVTNLGSNALYISKGGINTGCGNDGSEQYAFAPAAPSTIDHATAYVSIDGNCTKNHIVSFDYKLNPTHASNQAYVVYSLNGGLFWFVQDTLENAADWVNYSVVIDQSTNNNNDFLVGVRFKFESVNGNGLPLAIDNFKVTGTASGAIIPSDTLAVCGQSTLLISAENNYSGTGQWTLQSGQGVFSNASAHETGVNALGNGVSVFVWTVTSSTCGVSRDTLVVVNSQPPSFANVTDTTFACTSNQINITTTVPMSGTGMWSSPQGASFSNATSAITNVSNLPNGWSDIIWTVSAPGCPSNIDTMKVFKTGGQSILTADTSFCYEDKSVLIVNVLPIDSFQTNEWYFALGNGTITGLTPTSVQVSNLEAGENKLVYQVRHTMCPIETDIITIQNPICDDSAPVFPTVITPNGDGKNDLFVIHNIEKLHPKCYMRIYNRWGNVVFESLGYATPWDGTYKGEKLPMGVYYFKLELNDASNTVYDGPINIIH